MNEHYHNVNWVNGMKINRKHFIQEQNATIFNQLICIKSLLSDYSFGIFGSVTNKGIILEKSINDDLCELIITKLNGITSNGTLIYIDSNIELSVKIPKTLNDNDEKTDYFLGIKANPFNKIPYGTISSSESPPRYPYVIPEFSAVLLPAQKENINLSNILIIDKIIFTNNKYNFQDNYIPPSYRMSSDQKLIDIVNKSFSQLKSIQEYIYSINNKITSDSNPTNIAKTTNNILKSIIYPIEWVITDLKILKYDIPTVQYISGIMNIAMQYYNQLRLYPPKDKEEYINYLSSWMNLSTGQYETILDNFNMHKYNHNEIADSMQIIDEFLDVHESLLKKISELSFIGKKKDTNIFVKEHKSKHNFLLD